MHRPYTYLSIFVLALATACNDDEPGETDETNYWEHVAPIYFNSCVGCHTDGGIAPFRLDTYEDARMWAGASADAVANRTMPPYLITADGSCGDFHNSPTLSQEQIDTIGAWFAAGTPEGDPRDDLVPAKPPRLESGLDLQTPDFVPQAQGAPLATYDEYRCFLVEPGQDRDKFITGYDVLPGNPGLVHHVLAMPVDLDAPSYYDDTVLNRDVIEMLDAESPDRAGWPCFSAAGDGVQVAQIPVTWAPGMGAVQFPDNTGVRLRKDEVVVVQVHYNLHHHDADADHTGESDSTRVRLQLADSVEREGFFMLIDAFIDTLFSEQPDSIPPGQASAKYEWTIDVGSWLVSDLGVDKVELHGIFPHMHERGRKWRAELIDDSGTRCIGDVQAWDFAWQLYYFFEKPPVITESSKLRVTCDYDTRADKDPITPGWGTQNEMCLAGVLVVP